MTRYAKTNDMTDKDMSTLREADQAKEQRDKARGELRDYSLQHRVEMRWDMNEESIRDKMFILQVDDVEVILDAEQVMRYIRWV